MSDAQEAKDLDRCSYIAEDGKERRSKGWSCSTDDWQARVRLRGTLGEWQEMHTRRGGNGECPDDDSDDELLCEGGIYAYIDERDGTTAVVSRPHGGLGQRDQWSAAKRYHRKLLPRPSASRPFWACSVSSASVSDMIRLFPLSLLAVFVGTALADTAVEQQVLDTSVRFFDSWSYVNCGGNTPYSRNHMSDAQTGLPSDPIQLQSITLSPDPPKPGKDLTVTVSGTAHEAIKVRLSTISTT